MLIRGLGEDMYGMDLKEGQKADNGEKKSRLGRGQPRQRRRCKAYEAKEKKKKQSKQKALERLELNSIV